MSTCYKVCHINIATQTKPVAKIRNEHGAELYVMIRQTQLRAPLATSHFSPAVVDRHPLMNLTPSFPPEDGDTSGATCGVAVVVRAVGVFRNPRATVDAGGVFTSVMGTTTTGCKRFNCVQQRDGIIGRS